MFAVDLGRDDHVAALEVLALVSRWDRPAGRSYLVGTLRGDEHPLLAGCKRAYFLRIEPGGHIHRHTDGPAAEAFDADLIVVATNDRSRTYWEAEDGAEHVVPLELGKRYRMIARGLPHRAVNDGDCDRIHLLIEYPKVSKPPPGLNGRIAAAERKRAHREPTDETGGVIQCRLKVQK